MKYQLVLQFSGDSLADLDAAIALEDRVNGALGDMGEADGHDIGEGETNLFVITENPTAAFEIARRVLQKSGLLDEATAAYRELTGEDYTVLWPPGHRKTFSLA